MENRRGWWFDAVCVLMCFAMVVYGIAILWHLLQGITVYYIGICVSALLIVIVGAVCVLRDVSGPLDERGPSAIGAALEPYLRAWRRLWGTKWLLWVFGVVAAIAIASAAAELEIGRAFLGTQTAHRSLLFNNEFSLVYRLNYELPFLMRGAWDKFVPGLYLSSTVLGYTIAAVVLVILALPSLSRMRREPECAGRASFFAACLILAVLAGAAVAVEWLAALRRVSQTGEAERVAEAMQQPRFWTAMVVLTFVGGIIVLAAFVGGVLGSLARSDKGGEVTRRTFVVDSARVLPADGGVLRPV